VELGDALIRGWCSDNTPSRRLAVSVREIHQNPQRDAESGRCITKRHASACTFASASHDPEAFVQFHQTFKPSLAPIESRLSPSDCVRPDLPTMVTVIQNRSR